MKITTQPIEGGIPLEAQIGAIDDTLAIRSGQVEDSSVDSYTLELLRGQNEAAKKFGQESVEYLLATAEEDVGACESELADLIYAALIMARSRGKAARLGNVIGILIARNEASTISFGETIFSATTEDPAVIAPVAESEQ